jgi:hypothetical protein
VVEDVDHLLGSSFIARTFVTGLNAVIFHGNTFLVKALVQGKSCR